MENDFSTNIVLTASPELTDEMKEVLERQNSRKVSEFQAKKLEAQASKHWDLFYKRNDTRFFKDR